MAHAAEQVAHATPVPPVQSGLDYMARFSSELKAVEAALVDLKAQLRQDGRLGGRPDSAASASAPADKNGAVATHAALSRQLTEMEARLAARPQPAASQPAAQLDAPLLAKLSALADGGGGVQAGVAELQRGVGELHLEARRTSNTQPL